MELEDPSIDFKLEADKRPTMPQPPPVRLVAIEDLQMSCAAGLEVALDDFYVNVLHFDRESAPQGQIVYKAENFRLLFTVMEPPILRDDLRPIGIEVESLTTVRQALQDREIDYKYDRALFTGQDLYLLQDPAGNWVQISQFWRI